MAVLPVEKVHIIIHKSVKDDFLHELQREGLVHITEMEEHSSQLSPDLAKVNEALTQLSPYKKRGILEMFLPMKRPVSTQSYDESFHSYDYQKIISDISHVKIQREQYFARLRRLQDDIALLEPWLPFAHDLSVLKNFRTVETVSCIVPMQDIFETLSEVLSHISHSYEIVNTEDSATYCIFFVTKDECQSLRSLLIENECEIIELVEFSGVPKDIYAQLQSEKKETEHTIDDLNEKEQTLSREIEQLELMSDHITNDYNKKHISSALPETIQTTNIIGWIQRRYIKRLDALIRKVTYATYATVEPDPEEEPPVAIKNPPWTRPYEMLIKLYSMPEKKEYDPTPLLAVFFPVMFGLCLTDVLYGIILMLFSLYLIRKVVGDRSLMWILFGGGLCTVLAGAVVGGWASDLFVKLGWQPLIQLRATFMLFDPLSSPLLFIGIALGLGFIHMLIGIMIEIIDSFRNNQPGQAIFANLTWFILLPAILLYFIVFSNSIIGKAVCEILIWTCIMGIIVASSPEGKAKVVDQLVWAIILLLVWIPLTEPLLYIIFKIHYQIQLPGFIYYVLIPLVLFEVIRLKHSKGVLGKIAWGFYNLYGISSYLSVILSYVRLMALGLVTGVIGMAINTIAWMLIEIPVIGIIAMILVLIGGHLFNIAVNVLGGFIHTMRLQYIEFFGRFYAGGSKPFKPFALDTKYVHIE